MKRFLILILVLFSSLSFNTHAVANNNTKIDKVKKSEISIDDAARAKVLNDRLLEIKKMDKSNLSAAERKELRTEVKTIKEELQQLSGGIYLSIGAIIVILLLLILLL